MKKHEVYIVEKAFEGMTLKGFLKCKLQYSHRSIVAFKKSGSVTINGGRCHMNMLLKENDVIEISITDTESENIFPEQMELDIIFEDDSIIVVNKPANMPVHPTRKHIMGTLANGMAYYLFSKDNPTKIRLINRLDKDTSGLVVFAKSAHIQHLLSFFVGKEEFRKEYIAIVHGKVTEVEGTIDQPIARETENSMKRVVREDGDRAVTHFSTIAVHENYSVLRVVLETGRTHQIRVHLAYIGHPLLGDSMYGGSTEFISRQALHAQQITLMHPITKEWHVFTAPIPDDLQRLI